MMTPRPNRISICNESLISGGIGSYTMIAAEELARRGWKVQLIVTNYASSALLESARRFSTSVVPMMRMPLGLRKAFALSDLINEFDPAVLLLNHCALAHYALPALRASTNPIAVLHSDDPRFFETAALFNSRGVCWISPTPGLAENFRRLLRPEIRSRVFTIPHGIDESWMSADESTERQTEIVFAGFLGENKGADLLPAIFGRVQDSVPGAKLRIIGDGPLRAALEKRFANRGTAVEFCGRLDRAAVAVALQRAAALIAPTRIEGFGLAIVEAMMCGAVPVVSRIAGITDFIVEDGQSGILVAMDDIDGFAAGLLRILNEPKFRASVGSAARLAARERFTAQRMIDAYVAMFAGRFDTSPAISGRLGHIAAISSEMLSKDLHGHLRVAAKVRAAIHRISGVRTVPPENFGERN